MAIFANIYIHDFKASLSDRAKSRKVVGPYQWRPADRTRGPRFNRPSGGVGFYQGKGLTMDRHGSSLDLRLDYANTHLPYQRHGSGPFRSENDCDFTPIIARLPNGRGYLHGWTMGTGMSAGLDGCIWPTIEEAAQAAIGAAQVAAELDFAEDEAEDA